MYTQKLAAGELFPTFDIPLIGGGSLQAGEARGSNDWQMILVYRGKHCPLCTRYLSELEQLLADLESLGIDVVALSSDPEEKAIQHMAEINPGFDVGHSLTIEQMQALGLYISDPRSSQETDRPFAEPGLFVVNDLGNLQIIDISNAPFIRPNLQSLVNGLKFIRNPEHNYPIRGTRK